MDMCSIRKGRAPITDIYLNNFNHHHHHQQQCSYIVVVVVVIVGALEANVWFSQTENSQ